MNKIFDKIYVDEEPKCSCYQIQYLIDTKMPNHICIMAMLYDLDANNISET